MPTTCRKSEFDHNPKTGPKYIKAALGTALEETKKESSSRCVQSMHHHIAEALRLATDGEIDETLLAPIYHRAITEGEQSYAITIAFCERLRRERVL